MIEQFKQLLHDYAPIISVIVAALISGLAHIFRPKVKIIWGRANNSYNNLKSDNNVTGIYCEKYYVQNVGRKPATDVEFVYHHAPTEIGIWQARDYSKKETPEGNFMITIPRIAPKELVIIDSIYVNRIVADVISVKNGEVVGKPVNFVVNRLFSRPMQVVFLLTFIGGVAFYLSLLIKFFV